MILLPGRFIYLATPATGSRSVARVLVEQCDGRSLAATHHAHLSDVLTLKDYSEPAFTFIRDPYDYVIARYYHTYRKPKLRAQTSLAEFVLEYAHKHHNSRSAGLPYGMCRYADYADKFFRFADGLKAFFDAVGLPDVDILEDGMDVMRAQGPRITIEEAGDEVKQLIDEHFAAELALYRGIKNTR